MKLTYGEFQYFWERLPKEVQEVVTEYVVKLERERDEARAEVAAAYQRGAEAMREAAAQVFDRESAAWGDRLGGVMPKHHADTIRALPLPEDKS